MLRKLVSFTMISGMVFGVRGVFGNLLVHPKLLAEHQFDGSRWIHLLLDALVTFAGKQSSSCYLHGNNTVDRKSHVVLITSPLRDRDKTATENLSGIGYPYITIPP
ncbi:MAG: hypothetical protein ACLUGJ_13395 [Blautia wexlerae]